MIHNIQNPYIAVFESRNGYNNSVRLGRIYTFSCRGSVAYMCYVNTDLIELSFWIRHFIRIARNKIRIRIAARKITPNDLFERELGLINMNGLLKRRGF